MNPSTQLILMLLVEAVSEVSIFSFRIGFVPTETVICLNEQKHTGSPQSGLCSRLFKSSIRAAPRIQTPPHRHPKFMSKYETKTVEVSLKRRSLDSAETLKVPLPSIEAMK